MSLEAILAQFEQLRQETGRALQGQAVPSPGPLSVLGSVDTSSAPLELGLELADQLSQPSSPGRPLRGLAVQVEAARLSHEDELARRSAKLEMLKDELEGYGRDKLKLRREVDSLLLEVSRRQSTLSSMAAERGQLQEALGRLTAEVEDLRVRLADQTEQRLTSRRLYSRYKKKMDDYECRFVSLQCHSPATAEVAQLRETLAGLAERRAVLLRGGGVDVLSGQKAERLKAALEDVVGRVADATAQRQEAKELGAAHQQKRDRVVQACSMLKKRNQAQLLRVKRQLQECHAHKRRWEEEAAHLQATIDQFRGNLGHGQRN